MLTDEELVEGLILNALGGKRKAAGKSTSDLLAEALRDGSLTPQVVLSLLLSAVSSGRKVGAFYAAPTRDDEITDDLIDEGYDERDDEWVFSARE